VKIKILITQVIIFLILSNSIQAKSNGNGLLHITGQVIDSTEVSPLSYASVTVKGTRYTTMTGNDGWFGFDIPYDSCTLVATYIGYKNKDINIYPRILGHPVIIKLEKESKEIGEVVIITEKEKIIRLSSSEISSVKMSPKLISKLPNLGEVDIMRSFQLLPGISGTSETSSGLYVRGGTPDQNLILFDGMTIYHVDHFFGFFSAFNANTIDDIKLMKGGFPGQYGGRLSSVMEITGKPADLTKLHYGGGVSLLSGNGYLEVPIVKNKISFQIAARRSYSDLIQTSLYNKIFNLYNTTSTKTITPKSGVNSASGSTASTSTFTSLSDEAGPGSGGGPGGQPGGGRNPSFQQETVTPTFHFYDLNSKLTYTPTSRDEIFLSFYNGEDKLDQSRSLSTGFTRDSSSGSLTDITNWGNYGISSQWKRNWNEDYNSNIFFSYSDYFNLTDREYSGSSSSTQTSSRQSFDNANVSNKIYDFTFRFKNSLKINENHLLNFGTEITRNDIKYSGQRTDTLTVNGISYLFSLYLQDNISFNKLHILPSYRGDYFRGTMKYYSEPRFSVIYDLMQNISLKGAIGKYYQFVSCVTQEDILQGNKEYWLLDNNSNVPVSSAIHYIAGITYENDNYLFNIEAYYKDLNNVLEESKRATRDFMSRSNSYDIYAGTGIAKGIEFLAQKKYGNTTGWICYTIGSVIYNFPDLNYGKSFYANQDQTHEFKFVLNQTVKKIDFAGTFVYATGKPYTAPVSLYELTMLDGSVVTYSHLYDKNGYRLPAYSRIDVSATYNFGKKVKKHIIASVFNLLNHQNIWYKQFNPQGYQLNMTDVNYLGITPNISFSIDY
jgi:ferric enterobactin receptor